MISMTFHCSACEKEKDVEMDSLNMWQTATFAQAVIDAEWVCQDNNPHLDIYCSIECAE